MPKTPILGMGGISNGRDALEMIAAGASGVSIGTASFGNPMALMNISKELKELLAVKGFASVRDAVGFAHRIEESN